MDDQELTHIDLFSGIGGFTLAGEWAGFRTVVFCEKELFCQGVLKKHWPEIPIIPDIRDFDGTKWQGATILTGGFPCQDVSVGNTEGEGIYGNRSSLWAEMCRIIGEARPKYALVENVSNLLKRGLGGVLWDLAEVGYDAEWYCISAADIGAPHLRDRIWIVAYPKCLGRQQRPIIQKGIFNKRTHDESCNGGEICNESADYWAVEPVVGRVAYGIPNRAYSLKALGNAIIPQIAFEIMKRIAWIENERAAD